MLCYTIENALSWLHPALLGIIYAGSDMYCHLYMVWTHVVCVCVRVCVCVCCGGAGLIVFVF